MQLDFHKTLHVPKVSAQDCYFRKRLEVRTFGIYEGNRSLLHCYIYPEKISGEGPDEVFSLLDNLLEKITRHKDDFQHLIIYADKSPSQFKESYLFFYCCYLVKMGRFLRIDLKFLLASHTLSFCDRRFGNL